MVSLRRLPGSWLVFLTLLLVSWPSTLPAAEIVLLKSADLGYYQQAIEGFRATISEQDTVREFTLGGSLTRGQEIGKTLRASPPDLVFAVGLKAALAAKTEIADTPVVFCHVLDPETYGLPTSNMTGISMRVPVEQQMETLRAMLPHSRRVGVLFDKLRSHDLIQQAERHASRFGIELFAVSVTSQEQIGDSLRTLLPKIDALWLIQDQTVVSESSIPLFLDVTLAKKIPLITFSSTLVKQGAFGGIVVDSWEIGRQAGRMAGDILRGGLRERPRLVAPEHPQIALNLHTAEHLGLAPSDAVVQLATILYGSGAVAQKDYSGKIMP